MSTRNSLFAFAVGAAAGGTAALLLAPRRGEKTRERIREEADRVATGVKDTAREVTEGVTRVAGTHKEAAKEAAHAARDAYREELDRSDAVRDRGNPKGSR